MTSTIIQYVAIMMLIAIIFVVIEIWSMVRLAKKLKDNEGQVKREWQQFIEWVKRK